MKWLSPTLVGFTFPCLNKTTSSRIIAIQTLSLGRETSSIRAASPSDALRPMQATRCQHEDRVCER